MNTTQLATLFQVALLLTPAIANAQPRWGEFKADQCIDMGYRKYSSILWDIPWGTKWEDACQNMPATIKGQQFSRPDKCVNTGFNMWGEFKVKDDRCPYWGEFKRDYCSESGKRKYSAILWDVPGNTSWEQACQNMPATINGEPLSRPKKCVNTGFNMWGEYFVSDPSCNSNYGFFASAMQAESPGNAQCLQDIFNENEANWRTDGCSVPLNDPASNGYKDTFFQACMAHDYCYTLPGLNGGAGKALCDRMFQRAMSRICSGLPGIQQAGCATVAQSWFVGVAVGAQVAFDNAQDHRKRSPIASCPFR